MGSQQNTVDYILEQIAAAGTVSARKMFGEYAVYCDSKVVALICDDELFVKPTEKGRALVGECEEKPPYPGAKLYLLIADEYWDDDEWMSQLIKLTAEELPLPKKKKKLNS